MDVLPAPFNSSNSSYVSHVTQSNVELNMQKITQESTILKKLKDQGKIAIFGGVYQIKNGIVKWL